MLEFRYRPDVDGLRAVAVVLVLLFHAGLGVPGGYVGVDVFFVISGYLITGLVLKEQARGDFTLKDFWVRRVRRILPASMVMTAVVIAVGAVLLLPSDYEGVAKSARAQLLMMANLFFWRDVDYFGPAAEMKPLLHTWSLAVEEQFYLFYPLLLVAVRSWPARWKASLLWGLCIASFAVGEAFLASNTRATFFLLPPRAWELLVGCLLNFLPAPRRGRPYLELLAAAGLGAVLFAGFAFTDATPFPGRAALVPCLGAAAIIYSGARQPTIVGKLLASPSVVFVGLISYSLYLWHWPVLAYAAYLQDAPLRGLPAAAALVVSFLLAVLSWRFVETPLRRGASNSRYTARPILTAAVATAVLVGISTYIVSTEGTKWRVTAHVAQLDRDRLTTAGSRTGDAADAECFLPDFRGIADAGESVDVLVWGDSHARMMAPLCCEIAAFHGLKGALAVRSATPPHPRSVASGYRPSGP